MHVAGHADKTGAEAGNEQLALRRADVVAKYIVDRGVPREHICVRGKGSRLPLIPVQGAEPQNRRVEVSLSRMTNTGDWCK